MISFSELSKVTELPKDVELNLTRLHFVLNTIRSLWKNPMVVTSGYRTMEDHLRIYNEKNEKRKSQGLDPVHVPMDSLHLYGAAADISDPDGKLKMWVCGHLEELERLDVYCEEFDATPQWIHFQIYAPMSGKRFFKP